MLLFCARARAHAHTHTRARTYARTHARPPTHTHTHTHTFNTHMPVHLKFHINDNLPVLATLSGTHMGRALVADLTDECTRARDVFTALSPIWGDYLMHYWSDLTAVGSKRNVPNTASRNRSRTKQTGPANQHCLYRRAFLSYESETKVTKWQVSK